MSHLTGEFRGVVDRVVDDETAVVLVEEDEETVGELLLSVERLPDAADEEGTVLTLVLDGGDLTEVSHAPEPARQDTLQDRLDSLSRQLSEE